MTTRVRCPNCQKASAFSSADAGLTALCMACGARYTIPAAARAQGVAPPPLPPRPGTQKTDVVEAPARAPEMDMEAVASRSAAAGDRAVMWGIVSGGLVAVAALVVVLYLSTRPSWEERNRDALRDLKIRADSFALAGRGQEAIEAYDRILKLTHERQIKDAQLREDLEIVRVARDRLYERYGAPPPPQNVPAPPALSRDMEVARTQSPANGAAQPAAAAQSPESSEDRGQSPRSPNGEGLNPMAALGTLIEYYADPMRFADSRAGRSPPVETQPPPHANGSAPSPQPEVVPPVATEPVGALRIRRLERPAELVTDEEIGRAIQKGANWMIGQFENHRLISVGASPRSNAYHNGLNALCVYALLQSSYAIKDERLNLKGEFVRKLVSVMKESSMERGPVTYARAIRATALALIDRKEDKLALNMDVKYLLDSHIHGAYTYQALPGYRGRSTRDGPWDNSNSQYGLLGVWSGAEVGSEVNNAYWMAVEQHWTKSQLEDGSWGYAGYGEGGTGRLSMAVAGIASLFVTHDYLDAPKFGTTVGRAPFSPALRKGLAWLETDDRPVSPQDGYSLYGIERVGLASGFKFLGEFDWYKALARKVIDKQSADGSWGSELETAYHLLFLARGRHPILMNKLRFEGYWANRPRDVANLARFATKELERPLNWQVVPVDRDWPEWTDSPILSIASHTPPKLDPQDLDKIRSFVAGGGLLFTQADGGKEEMNQWAEELAGQIFKPYEMQNLPEDHEIFSLHYRIAPADRPRLRYVTNGSRVLMVHCPTDLAQHWQLRADKSKRWAFELGINLFLYAAGKTDLRNRLASNYIPPLPVPPAGGSINVVRVRYAGNWNPEPMAWTRFSRYFHLETDVGINTAPLDVADMTILKTGVPTVAHLTGTDAFQFTPEQASALRQFVERGGVLVIDPCGGGAEFLDSARAMIGQAFGGARAAPMPADHPVLTASGPGMQDVGTPQLRPYVKVKSPGVAGRLEVLSAGKGTVIVSPLDLTTGMLGANTWGVHGFAPAYSSTLMKNVLLWSAAAGVKDKSARVEDK
jgi:hypothetical protein